MLNWFGALKTAVTFYIASNVVGFIVGWFSNLSNLRSLTTTTWIIGIISAVVLMFWFGSRYFDDVTVDKSLGSGAMLGVFVVVFSLFANWLLLEVLNFGSTPNGYYSSPWLWVTVLATIATASFLGHYSNRSKQY